MSQNWRGSDWGRSDARPPWNNWFMITYEQTIEKERVGLPRAYPRVRKGYYTPLQVARKGTPRSTYQAFCDDVSPRPRRPRPPSDEELVAEAVARRPLSARHRRTAPLSADPPTITPLSARQPITPRPMLVPRRKFDPINPDESTYQAEYSRHFIPQPPSAREKGDPAGISYPRHDGTALCLDPSVEATRKIRMLRAQVFRPVLCRASSIPRLMPEARRATCPVRASCPVLCAHPPHTFPSHVHMPPSDYPSGWSGRD